MCKGKLTSSSPFFQKYLLFINDDDDIQSVTWMQWEWECLTEHVMVYTWQAVPVKEKCQTQCQQHPSKPQSRQSEQPGIWSWPWAYVMTVWPATAMVVKSSVGKCKFRNCSFSKSWERNKPENISYVVACKSLEDRLMAKSICHQNSNNDNRRAFSRALAARNLK